MNLRNLIVVAICIAGAPASRLGARAYCASGHHSAGLSGPTTLTAPPGEKKFPACCEFCPAGGRTGCNSGPQGLSCGSGLVLATCQMVNNVTTCVRDE